MHPSYRVPENVVAETLDGEAVVLHLGTGKYFALNGTGTRMWALLGTLGSPSRVLEELQTEFTDPDVSRLRSDLDGFIAELLRRGLLEERSG